MDLTQATVLEGRYLVEPSSDASSISWKVRDLHCSQCQRANQPTDLFCTECGHSLTDGGLVLVEVDAARQKLVSALLQTLGEDAWPPGLVGCRGTFQYLEKPCVLLDHVVESGPPAWPDTPHAVQNAVDVLDGIYVLQQNGFIPTLPQALGRCGDMLAVSPLELERASQLTSDTSVAATLSGAIAALRLLAEQGGQPPLVDLLDRAAARPEGALDLLRDGVVVSQCPPGLRLVCGRVSSEGVLRRGTADEDSALVLEMTRVFLAAPQTLGMYLVADGMGGHDAGEVASRLALETIGAQLMSNVFAPWLGATESVDAARHLGEAVEDAHRRIRRENTTEPPRDMGTTLNAALIMGDQLMVANVGDSRTYLYTAAGAQLRRFSHDQSLVQQMVDEGRLQPDEVYNDPRRNVILASLGAATPTSGVALYTEKLAPGDRVMLCSDGLWEMVRDADIEAALKGVSDPQECAERLVELAIAHGGEDNVTVIVVELQERKQL